MALDTGTCLNRSTREHFKSLAEIDVRNHKGAKQDRWGYAHEQIGRDQIVGMYRLSGAHFKQVRGKTFSSEEN
jgi:hypothetical protein